MRAVLRIETKGKETQQVELTGKDSYTIGRAASDVVVEDKACSRTHALCLIDKEGNFAVRDLGSSNGTRFNNKTIELATVEIGESFYIGETKITVVDSEPEGSSEKTQVNAPASVLIGWPNVVPDVSATRKRKAG